MGDETPAKIKIKSDTAASPEHLQYLTHTHTRTHTHAHTHLIPLVSFAFKKKKKLSRSTWDLLFVDS